MKFRYKNVTYRVENLTPEQKKKMSAEIEKETEKQKKLIDTTKKAEKK
jgi:hypothetical protein